MMKKQLVSALEDFPPTAALLALRRERAMQAYFRRIGLLDLEQRFATLCDGRVLQGPFEGMAYGRTSSGSAWAPKLLGCYEEELHGVTEEVIALGPDAVIDLGCAEGYYAAGFARRLPTTSIIAADLNPVARFRTRKLAAKNGAEKRLLVTGRVGKSQLQELAGKYSRTVVWCDIEGGEYDLIDPVEVTALRRALIVIEDHSGLINRQRDELLARLQESHDTEVIVQKPRSFLPVMTMHLGSHFNREELQLLCCEHRPSWQSWIVARPR